MQIPLTVNISQVLRSFLMILVIVSFGGVLFVFHQSIIDLLTTATIVTIIIVDKCKLRYHLLLCLILFAIVCVVHSVIVQLLFLSYVPLIYRFTMAILIITAFHNDYNSLKKSILVALKFFCFLALMNFVLINVLPYGMFSPKIAESGYFTRTLGFLFNHSAPAFGSVMRNCGPFWEPGVLQIIMNLLIYFILFEQDKPLKKAVWPIIAVITTFSTTGYIILGILLLVKFKKIITFSLKGIAIILTGIIIIGIVSYTTVEKLTRKSESVEESSSLLRIYDLVMTTKVALAHWPIGVGYSPERILEYQDGNSITLGGDTVSLNRGSTNSILQIFAYFGFILATIYFIFIYRQQFFVKKGLFFVIWMIGLASEPLIFTSLSWIVLVSGIDKKAKNTNCEIRIE